MASVLVVHGEGRPAEVVLPHLEVDVAAELRPVLADVEGLFGEDGLGGHRVHPAQVRPLAELEYAGGRLDADGRKDRGIRDRACKGFSDA